MVPGGNDIAVSKYAAGREKDHAYIATLWSEGLIELGTVEQRLDATSVNTDTHGAVRLRKELEALQGDWSRRAKEHLLGIRDLELAVKVMLKHMTVCLAAGGRIEIRGFGTFSLRFRPVRAVLRSATSATRFGREAVNALAFKRDQSPGAGRPL